ncbi:MAG: C-GCAxxG-C-C family protein [Candidatus Aminicenantes bacterium]|jgi:C_GCAxxG_C_C family probable redox protein|nr:C-GCAxxG-C-C family protein [Candidatus Aminicenantes bacterium]
MNKAEKAVALFKEGFSCSQAVFSAFSEDFGLDRNTSLKISQPFGGGMAHLGEACGAVTGAFMLIGLKYGRTKADDLAARDRTYAKMRQFTDRFKALHCSIQCRCLLGLDLGTEEGMRLAREKNLFQTICVKYVQDAATIVEEFL